MANHEQHMLVIAEGPNQGKTYPLHEINCTLGRSADNTVVFDSARVSRHHAQIRLLPSGAMVEDLGSTNGTWLNGQRLVGPRTLSPGDQIRLADYVTLIYVVETVGAEATVVEDMPASSTEVMSDVALPSYEPPPPFDPTDVEPVAPSPQAYEPLPPLNDPEGAPAMAEPPVPPKKRAGWLYAVIGLLIVMICLCVALAIYLWFAPVTFWERVFELVGIPMPSGAWVYGFWFM